MPEKYNIKMTFKPTVLSDELTFTTDFLPLEIAVERFNHFCVADRTSKLTLYVGETDYITRQGIWIVSNDPFYQILFNDTDNKIILNGYRYFDNSTAALNHARTVASNLSLPWKMFEILKHYMGEITTEHIEFNEVAK